MSFKIGAFKQNLNIFKQSARGFFLRNKTKYLIFLGALIFCLICAIFLSIKYASGLTIINIADKSLISFLSGKSGIGSLFFLKVLSFTFLTFLVVVLAYIKPLFIGVYLLIAYVSFVQFLNSFIFIILFGFFGFLFSLLTIILEAILLSFVLFTIALIVRSKNSCGVGCNRNNALIKPVLVVYLIGILIILCQVLLSLIFSPIIIIIV